MAKETAEQKLLRLIEQGGGFPADTSEHAAPEAQEALSAVQSVGGTLDLPPGALNVVAFVKRMLSSVQSAPAGFSLRHINIVLMAGVVILTVVFIGSIMNGLREADQTVTFHHPDAVAFSAKKLLPILPGLDRYVSAISFRNIFHPFEKQEVVEQADPEVVEVPQRLAEQTKNLRLVGISWLDTPESASAMVENTESGITYFLRSGERVNGLTVKTIYAQSVVLEMGGEELELKL